MENGDEVSKDLRELPPLREKESSPLADRFDRGYRPLGGACFAAHLFGLF